MIDGSEKLNSWLNFELKSLHVTEWRSNQGLVQVLYIYSQQNLKL